MAQLIVAGVDIGGTFTKYGFVNALGKVLLHKSIPTTVYQKPDDFANELTEMILREAKNFTEYDLHGIGIGSPNGNYFTGTVEHAPNLPWKGVVPLTKLFMDASGLPVVLTNDAKAAALGEMVFGGAKRMKHFAFITLGTGLGSGIVIDGKIVYGHDGFAGELGHTTIFENGRQCGCGRKGCLEQYCSSTGIVRTYMELLEKAGKKIPVATEEVGSVYIYEKFQQGEREAIEAFRYTGHLLGIALANLCCVSSPEAIFLFGGLARSGEAIFNPVKKSFEENLLKVYQGKTKILASQLPEGEAAILGAASLMWNELKR